MPPPFLLVDASSPWYSQPIEASLPSLPSDSLPLVHPLPSSLLKRHLSWALGSTLTQDDCISRLKSKMQLSC